MIPAGRFAGTVAEQGRHVLRCGGVAERSLQDMSKRGAVVASIAMLSVQQVATSSTQASRDGFQRTGTAF